MTKTETTYGTVNFRETFWGANAITFAPSESNPDAGTVSRLGVSYDYFISGETIEIKRQVHVPDNYGGIWTDEIKTIKLTDFAKKANNGVDPKILLLAIASKLLRSIRPS